MSAGLISANGDVCCPPLEMLCSDLLLIKTPSTTYKGSLPALIEVEPLTLKKHLSRAQKYWR